MKRIAPELYKEFRHIRVFRDDIEELYGILAGDDVASVPSESLVGGNPVSVLTETVEYDSLQELFDSNKDEVTLLRLRSREGRGLSLSISNRGAIVLSIQGRPGNEGAFHKITGLLDRCEQKFMTQWTHPKVLWVMFIIMNIPWLLVSRAPVRVITAVAATLIIIDLGLLILSLTYSRSGVVSLKYRKDCPGFWAANKDKVVLAVITTLIGAIIGGVFVTLFRKLFP